MNVEQLSLDFAREVSKIMNIGVSDIIKNKRKVFVSVNNAYYERPSSVIIEFEGSPARLPIFYGNLQGCEGVRTVLVDGKLLRTYSKKYSEMCEVLDKFLKNYNELTQNN